MGLFFEALSALTLVALAIREVVVTRRSLREDAERDRQAQQEQQAQQGRQSPPD